MSKINLLDQNTINKIAAGEVVERPAAVVKELIENAIDAGSNAITAEIKEGGISFIRITDNGGGIAKEEIQTAFLRHATSKIKTVEDLMIVSSLGFRGEALSSIASVAQVELLTKTQSSFTGVRYCIEGGEEKSLEDVGCPNGTTFIVRNLFYNTPARRKFLKSATTEAGYISDLIERLAVSHPDISFKFINNNQIKLHTSGNNNLKDVLYQVYGREITSNLLEVSCELENVKITGFIGKPVISRGNRNYENYFINGRYIRSGMICKAIEEAYKPYVMSHKYPFTALHYEIDTSLIDVNVHPTKLEIRFRNGEEVFQGTLHSLREALSTKEMIPEITLTQEKKKDAKIQNVPEPFEVNRRKQLDARPYGGNSLLGNNQTGSSQTGSSQTIGSIQTIGSNQKTGSSQIIGSKQSSGIYSHDARPYMNENRQNEIRNTEIGKLNHVIHNAYDVVREQGESGENISINRDSDVYNVENVGNKQKIDTMNSDNGQLNKEQSSSQHSDNGYQNNEALSNLHLDNEYSNNDTASSLHSDNDYSSNEILYNEHSSNGQLDNEQVNSIHSNNSDLSNSYVSNEHSHNEVQYNRQDTLYNNNGLEGNEQEVREQSNLEESEFDDLHSNLTGEQMNLFKGSLEEDETSESHLQFLSEEAKNKHRMVGQVFGTYWIVQYEDKMFIIDQHAAHEKILYEKLVKNMKEKNQLSQMILPPMILSLSMREEEAYLTHKDLFAQMGFEIEHFGGKEYSVRAVPSDMLDIAKQDLFVEIIDSLVEQDYTKQPEVILEKLASMSCKAAIKGNSIISYEEASALIDQLLELENPYNCPHGRPIIVSMSKYELEKKFKRII